MKLARTLVVAAALSLGVAPFGHGAESVPTDSRAKTATAERTIRGDVLVIEGEFYTIKDTTGHQVRLHVNRETKSDGRFKVGDKVEATVTAEGHAIVITLVIPQQGEAPLSPNMGSTSPPSALGGSVVP